MAQITKQNKYAKFVQPQKEINFHGLMQGAGYKEIEEYTVAALQEAKKQNKSVVRIITGKGIHSKSGPVIRPAVEKCLQILQRQGLVQSFKYDSAFGTGPNEGAIIVKL